MLDKYTVVLHFLKLIGETFVFEIYLTFSLRATKALSVTKTISQSRRSNSRGVRVIFRGRTRVARRRTIITAIRSISVIAAVRAILIREVGVIFVA